MSRPDLQELVRDEQDTKDGDDFIICANCETIIGYRADAIEVEGRHTHVRINPLGLEFAFDCYSEALGCTISGKPQHADTWFLGYMWEIASCTTCNEHLGWLFSGSDHFYGLIHTKIATKKG